MSRCFPYPPLGCSRNGARVEAVNESIKIQKELGKAITEHDKKKEKQERKKSGKSSRKENKKDHKSKDKHKQHEKSLPSKVLEEEAERSGLTEEHEQPVYSQSLCYSPDSSNKRKLDDLSASVSKVRGNVLRIRLPLQRHRDNDASTSADRAHSSEKSVFLSQQKQIITADAKEQQSSSINSKMAISISDAVVAPSTCDNVVPVSATSSKERRLQKKESRYKALIEDWLPMPLGCSDQNDNSDDQEWLFGTKVQGQQKRLKANSYEQCHANSTLWPVACYLPEVEVHALPYTIPF